MNGTMLPLFSTDIIFSSRTTLDSLLPDLGESRNRSYPTSSEQRFSRSESNANANNECTSSVVPEPAHAHAGDDDATQYDDYYDYIVNDHQLSSER